MIGNTYTYRIYDTTILFTHKSRIDFDKFNPIKFPHYKIFRDSLNLLGANGFFIQPDKTIPPIIRKHYFIGKYKDLEFKAQIYPTGLEITFFQNIICENKNGGQYDFDKLQKMPYMIRLEFIKIINKLKDYMSIVGATDTSDKHYKLAVDRIKQDYVNSCHKPQKNMDFDLTEIHGTTCDYTYNNKDRDGKTIYNGDIKYFRGYNGELQRGVVYYDLNRNWYVIINKFTYKVVQNYKLFDPTEEDFKRRRVATDRTPKEYLIKKEKLQQATSRELINELKRRGIICNSLKQKKKSEFNV